MAFRIIREDITKVLAEVIVNPANPEPLIGGGTDSAIYEAAGKEQLLAERELIGAIAPGEVAVTRSYGLRKNGVRYILHAVTSFYEDGKKGERKEEVQRAVRKSEAGRLTDLGFLTGDALYSAIRGAAFTLFPSTWYENYPYSALEPIILGVPVVGSRIGGVPEIVREGLTGDLFEAGNVSEMTDKIRALWDDRERLARYHSRCREEHFDTAEEYCEKLLAIYQKKAAEA